jgi:hypothetical protein
VFITLDKRFKNPAQIPLKPLISFSTGSCLTHKSSKCVWALYDLEELEYFVAEVTTVQVSSCSVCCASVHHKINDEPPPIIALSHIDSKPIIPMIEVLQTYAGDSFNKQHKVSLVASLCPDSQELSKVYRNVAQLTHSDITVDAFVFRRGEMPPPKTPASPWSHSAAGLTLTGKFPSFFVFEDMKMSLAIQRMSTSVLISNAIRQLEKKALTGKQSKDISMLAGLNGKHAVEIYKQLRMDSRTSVFVHLIHQIAEHLNGDVKYKTELGNYLKKNKFIKDKSVMSAAVRAVSLYVIAEAPAPLRNFINNCLEGLDLKAELELSKRLVATAQKAVPLTFKK